MATQTRKNSNKANPLPAPLLNPTITRPTKSDLYYWCDFIELKCLVDIDKRYSKGKLFELLDDTAQQFGDETDADSDDHTEDDEILESEFEDDLEENLSHAPVGARTSASDEKMVRIAGYFTNLKYRQQAFGDAYPFSLSEDGQEIKLDAIVREEQKLYIQLLLSSSLRLIPNTRWKDLTEPFEEFSAQIFSSLMPTGWMVHRFGAKGSTRYKGELYRKLKTLARDIRSEFLLKPKHFKSGNIGDGGLDLVAWHPMGDKRDSIPIALAQCGCTADEWSKKSLEASPSRLHPHLPAIHPWSTYYFMPHDLTESSGTKQDWQRRNQLSQCIIVDRLRLINLAKDYRIVKNCLTAGQPVMEALATTI